jgi:hypothetical protein
MHRLLKPLIVVVAVLSAACDTVQPAGEGTLVVEAFVNAGQPPPLVHIQRTAGVSEVLSATSHGVVDAEVTLTFQQATLHYETIPDSAGFYRASDPEILPSIPALSEFVLRIKTPLDQAVVSGRVPPVIRLRKVSFEIPTQAVEAVLVDTLDLGLDSLNLGLDAQLGFIYPVKVSVDWDAPDPSIQDASSFWVETKLLPVNRFSSSLIDFFLLPDQVLPESSIRSDVSGVHRWTGVYAVPVEAVNTPFPAHDLKVSVLRGDDIFARFATSRNDPENREPISNISGGVGFVGGISVDSLRILVQ